MVGCIGGLLCVLCARVVRCGWIPVVHCCRCSAYRRLCCYCDGMCGVCAGLTKRVAIAWQQVVHRSVSLFGGMCSCSLPQLHHAPSCSSFSSTGVGWGGGGWEGGGLTCLACHSLCYIVWDDEGFCLWHNESRGGKEQVLSLLLCVYCGCSHHWCGCRASANIVIIVAAFVVVVVIAVFAAVSDAIIVRATETAEHAAAVAPRQHGSSSGKKHSQLFQQVWQYSWLLTWEQLPSACGVVAVRQALIARPGCVWLSSLVLLCFPKLPLGGPMLTPRRTHGGRLLRKPHSTDVFGHPRRAHAWR